MQVLQVPENVKPTAGRNLLTAAPTTDEKPKNPQTFIQSGKVMGFCKVHRPKWCELTCEQREWYL